MKRGTRLSHQQHRNHGLGTVSLTLNREMRGRTGDDAGLFDTPYASYTDEGLNRQHYQLAHEYTRPDMDVHKKVIVN